MTSADLDIAEISKQVHTLLSPLDTTSRARVLRAVSILLGDVELASGVTSLPRASPVGFAQVPMEAGASGGAKKDIKRFFASKEPANKGEVLAIAARWVQTVEGNERVTKEELQRAVVGGGLSFDSHNFSRDIDNARRQSQFFVAGTGKDEYQLSYYGEQYVEALPDREAIKKLRKPRGRKKSRKQAAPKVKAASKGS